MSNLWSVVAMGACADVPVGAVDVQVSYRDVTGEPCAGPLRVLWDAEFERVSPVRPFGSFRGQRNFTGWWWFATTGEHVGFESWVERDHVMLLDFDPVIVGVSSQPFWLSWQDLDGVRHRHVPDYFARRRDGTAVVVDVRPDERVRDQDEAVFSMTAEVCADVGWDYLRVGCVDPVLAANVRWLSGYRHPRCLNTSCAKRLLQFLVAPATLAEVIEAAGDRLVALPSLFHLIWTGTVTADLRSGLLGPDLVVTCAEECAA